MPHYIDNLVATSLCLPSGAEQVVLCGSLKLFGMKAADCWRDESKPKQKFTIVQLLPSISDLPPPFKNNNLLVINVNFSDIQTAGSSLAGQRGHKISSSWVKALKSYSVPLQQLFYLK